MKGMTLHAKARIQQRGISELKVQLLHYFGEDHLQKGGCTLSYIPEKKLRLLRQAIDRLADVQVVKSSEDRVITAMHRTRHTRTTEYAA